MDVAKLITQGEIDAFFCFSKLLFQNALQHKKVFAMLCKRKLGVLRKNMFCRNVVPL